MAKVTGTELGMAGELRVASELLLRGHRPSLSLVDTGVDIVTDRGLRIQVKTASRGASGDYNFNISRWDKRAPHALENVDVLVLWAADTDSFWIVPCDVIRRKRNIRVRLNARPYRSRNWNRDKYLNAWEVLKTLEESKLRG